MRPSAHGVSSSARDSLTDCAKGVLAPATGGISTRSSSGFMAEFIICGRPSTRTEKYSTFWSTAEEIRRRLRNSCGKLLKGLQYVPRVIITDQLNSYGAAKREVMPSVEHRQEKGENNRAENSHQPTRVREKVMRRFKSAGQARALSLRLRDHLLTFPLRATSLHKGLLPGSDEVKIGRVERGDLLSNCGLKRMIKLTKSIKRP